MEQFLPPIILSIGVILPMAIDAGPFPVRKNLKPLLTVILCAAIWIAYYLALAYAHFFSYSPTLLVLSSAAGLSFLVLAFIIAWRSTKRSDLGLWFHGLGIFSLALAAAIWTAQADKTIVQLRGNNLPETPLVLARTSERTDARAVLFWKIKRKNGIDLIFDSADFANVNVLMVGSSDQDLKNKLKYCTRVPSGFPANRYLIQIEQ